MDPSLYARYQKKIEAAIARQDFIEIAQSLLRAFFIARNHRDITVVTTQWVQRALIVLAQGPLVNPYKPDGKPEAFYPCSLEDADKTSNYLSLIMILIYLDIEHYGQTNDEQINRAKQILHMIFGDKPCWLRFRRVCFQLLFAESHLTEGFLYTGELFYILANYMNLDVLTLKRLECMDVQICEHKCDEIMLLGQYVSYAKRFVNADGRSGVGYPVLKVLVDYAQQFLRYAGKGKRSAELKARAEQRRRREARESDGEGSLIKRADEVVATCKKLEESFMTIGGKTAIRAVPVRKPQLNPRERTPEEKAKSAAIRQVVKEINRRYANLKGAKSRQKIIAAMIANSAYSARMRGVKPETWERYATDAAKRHDDGE